MLENFKVNHEFNELLLLIEELIRLDKQKLKVIDSKDYNPKSKKNLLHLIKMSRHLEKIELKFDSKLKNNISSLIREGYLSPDFMNFIEKLKSLVKYQEKEEELELSDVNRQDFDILVRDIRNELQLLKNQEVEVKIIKDKKVKSMQRKGKIIENVEINGVKYILKAVTHYENSAQRKAVALDMKKEVAASILGENLINIAKYHQLTIHDIKGPIRDKLEKLGVIDFTISEAIDNDFKADVDHKGQVEKMFVFYNLIGDFDKMFNAHKIGTDLASAYKKFVGVVLSAEKLKSLEHKFTGFENGLNNIIKVREELVSFDHGDFGAAWDESDKALWVATDFKKLDRENNLKIPSIVGAVKECMQLNLGRALLVAGFRGREYEKLLSVLRYNQANLARHLVERFAHFHSPQYAETLKLHLERMNLL